MAKMKFYLNIEGEKLRTIDDLRENFFADSVLAHYQSGKLAQWLDVWNYKDELEQVRAIQTTDTREILAELCRIFGIEADLDDFETNMTLEDYLEEKKSDAAQKEERDRIKAATSEVNMDFFDDWIENDEDGSKRKKLNDWITLLPPLMIAITHGDASVVKTLIQEGADVNNVVKDEHYNYSALLLAANGNSPEIVKILIDAGANINAKNGGGWTALMIAVNKPEIAKMLINTGADVNASIEGWGRTPLMMADTLEVVQALIQAGANVNAKDEISEETALFKANKPEIIRALVKAGADVNVRNAWGGRTALMSAVTSDTPKIDVIKALAEVGIDVNAKDEMGDTALMHAVIADKPNIDVIKALIDVGSNINEKDGAFERTALMKAENVDVIRMLVHAGANINARDMMGSTALMIAATADEPNMEVIKTLIELGSNVNAKDYLTGNTILAKTENRNVQAILRASGAR